MKEREHGQKPWAVNKSQYVVEMRELRWMSRVTKLDRIRNKRIERIRGIAKVGEISNKVHESSLKWYVRVQCIEKRRRMYGQAIDGDIGAVEEKERKSEAQVVG